MAESFSHRSIGNPNEVDIMEFPWQAAVIPTSADSFLGAAAIISKTHLLTSGSCIKYSGPDTMHITIGSSILDEGIKYQIKSHHTHPNFTGAYPFLYDIAVIEIDGEIEFDKAKSPIPLPDKDVLVPIGATVTLAGWGIELAGSFSKHLRKQKLIIVEKNLYNYDTENPMGFGQLCGLAADDTPSCLANLGTGVVYEGILVGIAVAGTPCGQGLPEIITRVYDHMDWIREVINNGNPFCEA